MCGNPFSGPSPSDRAQQQYEANARAAAEQMAAMSRNLEQSDQMDPAAIAARQRIARRMSEGIRSTFATSSRGTEGAAGSGLGPPPGSMGDEPIITTMEGRSLPPGMLSVDDRAAADAAEAERRKDPAYAAVSDLGRARLWGQRR